MTSSWMLVAGFFFAAMGVIVKYGSGDFDSAEMAFYRSFVGFILVSGIILARKGTVRTARLGGHAIRSVVGTISLIGYYHAMALLPLATAQTLNYTSPIFLAIATVVVLGEKFSGWLVVAIAVGFCGVALLLQPTVGAGKEAPALIGLFSGVFSAWAYLSVRTLGQLGEPDYRVVFYFTAIGSVLCAAWQLSTSHFHPVTASNIWVVIGIGFCGTVAQLCMTRAYRTGNTLVVGALSYSTLVFSSLATFLVWDERLAPAEIAGIAIIVAGGLLAMRVERKEQIEEAGFES
ncbi:MAG TPA: DMT family transporter [Usitatibacter sp.]|nr:DMT family transporter [Usitatibacter sp.]